jgi:hypothetical protein
VWQYNEIASPHRPPPPQKEKKKTTTKLGEKKCWPSLVVTKVFKRNYPKNLKTIKFSFFLRFSEKQISKNRPLKNPIFIYLFFYFLNTGNVNKIQAIKLGVRN